MIIINSADYIIPELRNEFGLIPPCFLPIGNKKLLYYQLISIKKYFPSEENIFVSLPEKYRLNVHEIRLLNHFNVQPIFVPEQLTLGMALIYVLNVINLPSQVLRLLHGDTLLNEFPENEECIGVSLSYDNYTWEFVNENSLSVWCGYFSFISQHTFLQSLAIHQGDFVKAVHHYTENNKNIVMKEIIEWYDLGHINTYFKSRTSITTQRIFNQLRIKDGIVWKSGEPSIKIQAEIEWFKSIPSSLKKYIPQLINSDNNDHKVFYELEYLPCLPLNEIFVHGKNRTVFWERLFDLIFIFLDHARKEYINNSNINLTQETKYLYEVKTLERLFLYEKQTKYDISSINIYNGQPLPSIIDIAKECIFYSLELPIIGSIIHGDLCFSNILYDSRAHSIKLIDPRGLDSHHKFCLYGNQIYDIIKLMHSIIGLYDFIISDMFILEEEPSVGMILKFDIEDRVLDIQNYFLNYKFIEGVKNIDLLAPTILLFLSMLPLHHDQPLRQKAMLANALRLYILFKKRL